MKSISKLKDQARAHEQKENWQAAIEAYQKVLSALDDTETELDLSLYNRIGDLYYRVGQPDRAVHYYSQAAQKYAEVGLFNNAIALCNKALRYRPNDVNLFRMLGEFSAEQGFLVEARRWYLQYAERQVQVGKVEEAFAALEEFAALADDPSVRETLADQFLAHDRTQEALQQLERAYAERIARGESMEASIVAGRIRELDPTADLQALARELSPAEPTEPEAEDTGLIIETSAGSAGFHAADADAGDGMIEKPSGLETRPDDTTASPADGAVSGLELGFSGHDAPPAPGAENLAGMETFDAADVEAEAPSEEVLPDDTVPEDDTSPEAELAEAAPAEAAPTEDVLAEDTRPEAELAEDAWPEDRSTADALDETEVEPEPLPLVEPDVDDTAAAESAGAEQPEEEAEEPAGPSAFDLGYPESAEPEPEAFEEEEFAADEEPEPLPLLDLGEDMALDLGSAAELEPAEEPEMEGGPDLADEAESEGGPVLEAEPEPQPEPGPEPVDMWPDEEGPVWQAEAEPGPWPEEETAAAEADREAPAGWPDEAAPVSGPEDPGQGEGEPAAAQADGEEPEPLPLLDLGDGLLPDVDLPEATDEAAVAAFDLGAFDLTLADATEAAETASTPDIDTNAVLGRARELVSRELHDQALSELHLLLVPQLDPRMYESALAVVDEMVRRNPDDFPALQRRVAFASLLGDTQVLATTYADLAACLMRKGAETKAATVYRRVLELDPNNEAAREVLGVGPADGDAYVDLAAFLDDEGLAAALASGDDNAPVEDFAELFSQFKAKVTEDVAVEESGSHYDLGLAFKEMGLIDEAIAEFQTALRGGEERLKVYEELGQCFMLKEQYTVAVKILARALELPREDPHELLGVYYHLGMCHEELGDRNAARQAYDNIMVIDPSFSDVPERLSRL